MTTPLQESRDNWAIAEIIHSLLIGEEATRHDIVDRLLKKENSNMPVIYTRERMEGWAKEAGCQYSIRSVRGKKRGIFHK